jgi:hypothetical protein
MDDQLREYLIGMTIKHLSVSRTQAELRLEALIKSGVLNNFNNPTPESDLFRIITDIAMQIPQLQSKL